MDLENGGDNQRRPPPRRFQHRLHLDSVDPSTRGLATLPEGETGQEEGVIPPVSTYQRVYRDRRPSVKLNTDIVGAMEAIEGSCQIMILVLLLQKLNKILSLSVEVQSPTKERPRKLFERSSSIISNPAEEMSTKVIHEMKPRNAFVAKRFFLDFRRGMEDVP